MEAKAENAILSREDLYIKMLKEENKKSENDASMSVFQGLIKWKNLPPEATI